MYLQSLHNTVPDNAFSQAQCWEILQSSGALARLTDRSGQLLEKVLKGDSGIDKRHFAHPDPANLFRLDAEALNRLYESEAPRLAARALGGALDDGALGASELDALVVCTCTGYLCPGLSSFVAERLGMRPDAYLQDLVGLGCGAALPALRAAAGVIAHHPQARVGCVAVEVSSAAFFMGNDPGVLISLCLFGDGASASVWSGRPGPTGYRIRNFDTIHRPRHREKLRFTNSGGRLRNQLHPAVPVLAAEAVQTLHGRAQTNGDTEIASHSGGRDVIAALQEALPEARLETARHVLRDFGNMSSPSVLFSLERALEIAAPTGRPIWLTSFGAGFSAHSALMEQNGED